MLTPYRAKRPVTTHSLPLAQYLGTIDAAAARTLAAQLTTCRQTPGDTTLRSALAAFEQVNLNGSLTESSLVERWRRYFVPAQWPDAQVLGDVLQARLSAERLATPVAGGNFAGDERAHAWLRPDVAALDRLCRKLEDSAVLGPQAGDLQTLRTDAANAAEQADEVAQNNATCSRSATSYGLRCRTWPNGWPGRKRQPATQEQADLAIRQTLLPLIADGLTLESQLVRIEPTAEDAEPGWTADAVADEVGQRLTKLGEQFRAATKALQSAAASSQAVADIDAALAAPLVPWDTRQQLRQKKLDLLADLVGKYRENGNRPTPDEKKDAAQPAAQAIAHAERIATRWPQHPLVRFAARVPAAEAKDGEFASLEDRIRRQLLTLSQSDLTHLHADSGPATTPPAAAEDEAAEAGLNDWCQAESLVRTAAAIWFDPPGIDPVESLRQADLQQLLFWQARRALDDFYGPAVDGGEPLFATAATDYLNAAKAIAPFRLRARPNRKRWPTFWPAAESRLSNRWPPAPATSCSSSRRRPFPRR